MTSVAENPTTSSVDNDQKPVGFGRMLRKEDAALRPGSVADYVDDMTADRHAALWRSCAAPMAHGRIVSVDTTAAEALPRVKARRHRRDARRVSRPGVDADAVGNDVQAVLATDKVRFQGQEVAFVVAEDKLHRPRRARAHRRGVRRSCRPVDRTRGKRAGARMRR